METKNRVQYEIPSAEVLFVTVEQNILSGLNGTTIADDTYEEEDA